MRACVRAAAGGRAGERRRGLAGAGRRRGRAGRRGGAARRYGARLGDRGQDHRADGE